MFKFEGKKPTEKDLNLYEKLEVIEAKKEKRKMKARLIYGGSLVLAIVAIASLFIPASQVEVITRMLDTIFKYLPSWG